MLQSEKLRRAALAIVLLASAGGVLLQYVLIAAAFERRGGSALDALWRLLIFFTILTNILAAAACVSAWRDARSSRFLARPATQAAIVVYIAVVGIVYAALLARLWNPQGWQYVADMLIHRVSPIAFIAYWLAFAPKGALRWSDPLKWLIYPLAYFVYALARGAFGGFYPYPFIDVAKLGSLAVALNSLMMLALFVALGLAIVALDRALGRRHRVAPRSSLS